MTNVFDFPKKFRPPPLRRVDTSEQAEPKAKSPRTWPGVALMIALQVLRLPVFLVLYWLRLPVMLVCNVISIPLLLACLFSWYAFPERMHMVIAFGAVSFTAFVILWTYDFILMALSPQELVKGL